VVIPGLGLGEKTLSHEDDAAGQLHPSEIALGMAIPSAGDAAELIEQRVGTLDTGADPAQAASALSVANVWSPESKTLTCGTFPGRGLIGKVPVRSQIRHAALLGIGLGRRGDDDACQRLLGKRCILTIGSTDTGANGQIPRYGYEHDLCAGFTTIHWRGADPLAPFFAGFREPSMLS
jgi:hypothetical protein